MNVCIKRMVLALTLCLPGAAPLGAQIYSWHVTHNKEMIGKVVALETARGALESKAMRNRLLKQGSVHLYATRENYDMMRNLAQTIRLVRMAKKVKESYKNMSVPVWTMIPRISFRTPGDAVDADGNPIYGSDGELFSLSIVPDSKKPEWGAALRIGDDETLGSPGVRGEGNGRITVTVDYPHKLSDLYPDLTSSALANDFEKEDAAIADFMEHTYENILDAAAVFSGRHISVNPKVLADGTRLFEGRLSPENVRKLVKHYCDEANECLTAICDAHVRHGVSLDHAQKLTERDREYWSGFLTSVTASGAARMAFAMNCMNEINQAVGRMETNEKRRKDFATDHALENLGKKREKDSFTGQIRYVDQDEDFFDRLLKATTGDAPGDSDGAMVQMQCKGLSARYSHSQFEEARALRNVMLGIARVRVAVEGTRSVGRADRGIKEMERIAAAADPENLTHLIRERDAADKQAEDAGWQLWGFGRQL
jgi:hypothetical protein